MTGLCECGCGERTSIAKLSSTEKGWVRGQPMRFRRGHRARLVTAGRWAKEPLADKYRVNETTGCWEWERAKVQGYGYYRPPDGPVNVRAHRYMYELLVGPIPEGLTLDHLCRVRSCVNPAHLEPVTSGENTRRATAIQTHCLRGHPLSGDNLYVRANRRHCRACRRMHKRHSL